jgi:hypothetical protein
MVAVEQVHLHLHEGLKQLGGVIGHHGHEEGVAAGAALDGLGVGGNLVPAAGGSRVAGLLEQAPVGQGHPSGEVPGNRELQIPLPAGLPHLG